MSSEESFGAQVLPTLLTSRRCVRDAEVIKPQASGRALRRHATSEVAVTHAISVKNTFVDYGSHRSPSLEPFYRERKASSCPSSPATKSEAPQEEGFGGVEVVGHACGGVRKGLPAVCSSIMDLPCQQIVPDAPTRCPSMDSPADWQHLDSSPLEVGMTMAQFAPACASPYAELPSVLQPSAYTPVCGYPTSYGGDAFCLAGPSPMASIMQPPVSSVAQVPQMPLASRPQAQVNHAILSLADAIGEPAGLRLPRALNSLAPGPHIPVPPAPPAEPPQMSIGGSALAAAMATAVPLPPAPPPGPAPGSAELPSIGSAGHSSGDCKPCAFFHTAGCSNGVSCQFCHTCDANEKKRRRKEKIQRERLAGKAKQPDPVA
mmetsp:Transcript_96227/g.241203  ORF Transcript_96227/g.241203 Transcript_96227/m.241203 type:complete len:375 (-) Transcript_96227:134-1258(-)